MMDICEVIFLFANNDFIFRDGVNGLCHTRSRNTTYSSHRNTKPEKSIKDQFQIQNEAFLPWVIGMRKTMVNAN